MPRGKTDERIGKIGLKSITSKPHKYDGIISKNAAGMLLPVAFL
jgi:hypothetical protein